jgi:protein-disulfide isomerase
MPSQKQAKKKRRQPQAPPPPRPQGGARRASPKVLIAAGVAVVLVVLAVVLALALTGGDSSSTASVPAQGSLTNALPGAEDVDASLAGIPQSGTVLGAESAPVTLVEYVDLQCPFCQQFETSVMPSVVERYVKDGKVKVDARIVAFIGPDSERGRSAALAAGLQDKLFNFTQLLYLNQGPENTGWLDDDLIERAAASIPGLDVHQLLDDKDSGAVSDQAAEADRQAEADNISGTPTILVGKTGQKPQVVALSSPTDEKSVTDAIDAALG